MILPLMTNWPDGSKTYFIDKIWNSIYGLHIYEEEEFDYQYNLYLNAYTDKFGKEWEINQSQLNPKQHTIRLGYRWKVGDNIHMFIHSRSKKMFRFAPVIKCISTQQIIIQKKSEDPELIDIRIDGRYIYFEERQKLSINDGFEHLNNFYHYFNKPCFKGQIVHWTSLKY
jgi:hypothetical protein